MCEVYQEALKSAEDSSEALEPCHRTLLTEYSDIGDLLRPNSVIYRICREAERIFQKHKHHFLTLQLPITEEMVQKIKRSCTSVQLPLCCKVVEAVINYYLIVRCKGMKNYFKNKRAHDISFKLCLNS